MAAGLFSLLILIRIILPNPIKPKPMRIILIGSEYEDGKIKGALTMFAAAFTPKINTEKAPIPGRIKFTSLFFIFVPQQALRLDELHLKAANCVNVLERGMRRYWSLYDPSRLILMLFSGNSNEVENVIS